LSAASVIILVVAGFLFLKAGNSDPEKPITNSQVNKITTHLGSKSKVQLPDGTTVQLNAGSQLTYNKDFGKNLREVTLVGEGYFDVVKNKEIPFIIHTSNINIKVLGTVFNVKAYPEDNKTETSLIHGSIEVTIKNRPNDKIILSPSEKLVVENSSLQSMKDRIAETRKNLPIEILPMVSVNKLEYAQADSSIAEIQWVENKLVFRDRSFVELVSDMERWYNVTISISDQELEGIRLTGIFENETIEQALDALKISTAFVYEKKRNKIIIHR
jgi:ferric-dicitrate binding protein FerR (iron transport regulator)